MAELEGNGTPDAQVFALAQAQGRAVLTHNVLDFQTLAQRTPHHSGVLAVFRDGDPRKNMRYEDIAKALLLLEQSGLAIAGAVHVLNHWR